MIAMSKRNKLTKTKEASGNGLRGLRVEVLFLPIVAMKVSSNSNSPTIITIILRITLPGLLNASCKKIEEVDDSFLKNKL